MRAMGVEGVPAREALRELFPLKLVGGFIAVDQRIGCVGCGFCLARRHALWRSVFDTSVHYDGAFASPEQAARLLEQMLPFTRARVPIRFGHNTDARFQLEFGRRLYELVPPDGPFVFMTRFPLEDGEERLSRGQPNLLLKMTITPPSADLGVASDVQGLLRTVRKLPAENVYVLVGPLVADNLDGARGIIDSLSSGTWADVKMLTTSGLPHLAGVRLAAPSAVDALRLRAVERGLVVTDFFCCLMRRRMGRRFYKGGEAPPYVERACRQCEQYDGCYGPVDCQRTEQSVRRLAAEIGLELGSTSWVNGRVVRFSCPAPAARGDETYLSELTGVRVLLDSVPDGTQGGSFCLEDEQVLRRWAEVGMFPSDEVSERASGVLRALARRAGARP